MHSVLSVSLLELVFEKLCLSELFNSNLWSLIFKPFCAYLWVWSFKLIMCYTSIIKLNCIWLIVLLLATGLLF